MRTKTKNSIYAPICIIILMMLFPVCLFIDWANDQEKYCPPCPEVCEENEESNETRKDNR